MPRIPHVAAPLSMYSMSGMARYDLRHAAVQEGAEERISVTFRCCVHAERLKRKRPT